MIKKRTVIILTLIISFIFMIISLLSYFEITRYFKVKYKSTESYISDYKNIPKLSDKKIVVSFSISDSLDNHKAFLNSIIDQTIRVDSIDVNISNSQKDKNLVSEDYKDILTTYYIGGDYGKFNGFLPTMERETDKGTIIIWVKPDYIYPSDMIQDLVEKLESSEDSENSVLSVKKNGRIVVIASTPNKISGSCFYSSTNKRPEDVKNKNIKDIVKCNIVNVSCSNLYTP
jgi:hypothetical protein